MNLLEKLGLKRKPTRRERVQQSASDAFHAVADALDEAVAKSKKKQARAADAAQGALDAAQREAHDLAESAGDTVDALREQVSAGREQAEETTAEAVEHANAKMAATLAALGGLTANWDEVLGALTEELSKRAASAEEGVAKAEKKVKQARKKRRKKQRGYPGFWIWLLRLGLGVWYVQRLRSRDVAAYIDHGAGDDLRAATEGHPVAWYKDLLDNLLIPNASLVGLSVVGLEGLSALGYLTGINRRLAALAGVLLSGNELLLNYQDEEKKGEHLALLLSQLLLLRTGG